LPAGDDHKAYFQGEQFGTILNYVQTHPRTASLKEKKDQLIVTFDEVKSLQQAKRVMSELGSEESVEA
jgi:transcription-repair coupling factor (superfamily II helicase)